MKYLSKIFAVAVLGIAAACTEKEIDQVTPQNNPQNESGTVTFTATIPATKGYDSMGKMTWEEGDIILLWTNNLPWTSGLALTTSNYNTGSYAGKFDVVTVTDEMFTDGTHRTISFSINSDILPAQSPSPTRYYALTTHDLGILYHCANGSVSTVANKLNTIYAGTKPHLAVATCEVDDTKLTFKNAACVFQWDTEGTEIDRIEMEVPNSGGSATNFAARQYHTFNAGTGEWTFGNQAAGSDAAALVSYTKPSGGVRQEGPYYIMLAPGMTFDYGFKFKIYTSSGLLTTMIPTTSSFETVDGDFWDFGKLEDQFDSNYAKYQIGCDIQIGDLTVNKTVYPSSKLVSSIEDTYNGAGTIYAQWGVIFLNPGIDGVKLSGSGEKCIVIGNDPSQRSSIQIGAQISLSTNANVAFSNLNMSWASGNTGPWFASNSAINNFAFDNCRIDFYTRLCELGTGYVNSISVTNSDIIVRADATDTYPVHCGFLTRAETEHASTNLIFRNNLVATETEAVKGFGILTKFSTAPSVTFNTIDISHNTFHNVKSVGAYIVEIKNIASSATLTKNLLWKGDAFNWVRLSGCAVAAASFDYSGVTDNKMEGYALYGSDAAIVGTPGWYPTASSSYPFAQGDNATVISTRDYTVIPALAGYGVTDPKRLQ